MLLNTMFNNPLGVTREMDRLFDSMMSSQPLGFAPALRGQWSYPAINVWEDEDNFVAEAELPGMSLDDIEVLVTDDELTIKGAREIAVPEESRPLRRERASGVFERTITVPGPIDGDGVEAKLTHGVLSITMPKAEAAKPRRIKVRGAKSLPKGS
ncbi:MAG: Hsp20/alpha crystallin family protein [Phycisphaerales bacterium]|nr:Hsp20/alpha crystallin family protein [Phycisphaerae bacterium]NNM27463.1 Hsp20/alpha crystallin family protein [Phycisphaerales bacterium]